MRIRPPASSSVCSVSDRTGIDLPRRVAQRFADHLNAVLNRTVSDSRLSVTPVARDANTFQLTRIVDGIYAPLELDGTQLRLFAQQVVVVDDDRCKTESYAYRLQTDASLGSWLIRWEYVRDPPPADYAYPRAHVHVNGRFLNDAPIGALHIPTRRVPLELVMRHLITDWNVKPRSDDWEAILDESVEGFDERRGVD